MSLNFFPKQISEMFASHMHVFSLPESIIYVEFVLRCVYQIYASGDVSSLQNISNSVRLKEACPEQPCESFAANYQLDLCLDFNLDLN